MSKDDSRINEWFVPKFGPIKFRVLIGLLFLPYTSMSICFTVLGGLLSPVIHLDRLFALAVIYFLGLGLGAHAADALGSKRIRPWANYITKRELKLLLILGLVLAYSIGLYYIVNYVPFLALIAISEGFFLFAYNFELFGGFFHNNFWFAISWGAIPLLAGFVMQTDSIAISAIMLSFLTGCVSYIEIRLSREYKALKRTRALITKQNRLEISLKAISLGTIAVTIASVIVSYFCSVHISLST